MWKLENEMFKPIPEYPAKKPNLVKQKKDFNNPPSINLKYDRRICKFE